MAKLDPDTIAWAKTALRSGASMEYVASVLEVSERKARSVTFERRRAQEEAEGAFNDADPLKEDGRRLNGHKRYAAPPVDTAALICRRKALMRRRFAKNWGGIWTAFSRRMSGRTIRNIYGNENLIWAVGGGIDAEVPDV